MKTVEKLGGIGARADEHGALAGETLSQRERRRRAPREADHARSGSDV